LDRRLGRSQELVWTQRLEEKSSASAGDRTPVVQSLVRQYTDWVTAAVTERVVNVSEKADTVYSKG
jgi:hypothetical protein